MDPLADKLLVTSALVSLVSLDRLQAWVAMVIIAREFAVTGLRQLAMEHGEVIHASAWGKVKTAVQIAMVLVLILVDDSPLWVDVARLRDGRRHGRLSGRLLLQLPADDSRSEGRHRPGRARVGPPALSAAVEPLARGDVMLGVLA